MSDDGLTFFATLRKPDGSEAHRETPNRQEFLDWIDMHYSEGDDLTVSMEARGPAVANMLAGLRFGARLLAGRVTGAADDRP